VVKPARGCDRRPMAKASFNRRPRGQRTPPRDTHAREAEAMTVPAIPEHRYRTKPTAAHVYTMPVVRELPSQPIESSESRTW
jgi:hypothetical protein